MLYAVETRNMHNAQHEIFVFKDLDDAEVAVDLFNAMDDIYEEEGTEEIEHSPLFLEINLLWEELNNMKYEHFEVNYRWRSDDGQYKLKDDRIVQVINPDNVYDIY